MKILNRTINGFGHSMIAILLFCEVFWMYGVCTFELNTPERLTILIGFGAVIVACTCAIFTMVEEE